jgi:hypothetical protein
MTKDQAVEKCLKAISRQREGNESGWDTDARTVEIVKNIVTCLQELGLLKTD